MAHRDIGGSTGAFDGIVTAGNPTQSGSDLRTDYRDLLGAMTEEDLEDLEADLATLDYTEIRRSGTLEVQ